MIRIALYIRLSKEIDRDNESESIKNQRDLLSKYVIENYKNSNVKEFVDEGFSGTNFNRPAFKKLIHQVENNEIDIVIVKDLSRFGRNYIDSMHYINQIFPLYNVKLISVNDNIEINNVSKIETNFKALVNAYYSKDLSKKIKSARRSRALKGEWHGESFYGYKKSETKKNRIELDYEASLVIVDIFKMALDGMKASNIAKVLNDNQVLTPMEYIVKNKRSIRENWENKSDEVYWTYDHIWRIIKDERYMGKVIFNKKELLDVGGKRRRNLEKDNWIIVDNAIEPIVSEEVFQEAQKIIKKGKNSKGKPSNDVLINKIVCGKCNRNLKKHIYSYKKRNEVKYNCIFYLNTSYDLCFDGHIYRDEIEKVIIENIKMQIEIFADLKQLEENKKVKYSDEYELLKESEYKLSNKLNQIKIKKADIIEDLLEDKISTEEYKKFISDFENEIISLEQDIDLICCEKEVLRNKLFSRKTETILETLSRSLGKENIIDCIADYIDKILVFDKNRIEIVFNFNDIWN